MAGLTLAHRAALARLIARCPPDQIEALRALVAAWPGAETADLMRLVDMRRRDGELRDLAFAPILPLFRPRTDGVAGRCFPEAVLPQLWAAARDSEPDLLERLDRTEAEAAVVAERLYRSAAAAVRDRASVIWPTALAPEGREEGLAALAHCLDLAHLARAATARLEDWLDAPEATLGSDIRDLFRQAADIHQDGPLRLAEMLFARMKDAALVLRLLPPLAGAPGRRALLSPDDGARFIHGLTAAMRARADRLAAFRPGPQAMDEARNVMADIDWCAHVLSEMDVWVDKGLDEAATARLREIRLRIGRRMGELIHDTARAVDRALPLERETLAGRMTRKVPRLDVSARSEAVASAEVLVWLLGAGRSAAAVFGREAERRKQADALGERLEHYADAALERINAPNGPSVDGPLALMGAVAGLLDHLHRETSARTVRRRAAAARAKSGAANPDRASPAAA